MNHLHHRAQLLGSRLLGLSMVTVVPVMFMDRHPCLHHPGSRGKRASLFERLVISKGNGVLRDRDPRTWSQKAWL